jgi:multidrug efflux pump subunit AcrA (membrane-fusion protein)
MSRLLALLKWPLTLLLLGGVLAAAYVVHGAMQRERAGETEGAGAEPVRRVENRVIKLGAALARAHGLDDEPAVAVSWQDRVAVQGRVVPNPRATAELRAPFAGTLRAELEGTWPVPGQWVKAGQVLGQLDIRVGPQERIDLESKLAEAKIKQQGAEAAQKIQQERLDRLNKLSGTQATPQSALDDARIQLKQAETEAAATRATAELLQHAHDELKKGTGTFSAEKVPVPFFAVPLTAPADGEVAELAARPGAAVEAGAVLAQVVDFRRPLVRLDLPPEVLAEGPPRELDLVTAQPVPAALLGAGSRPEAAAPAPSAHARLLGPGPQVDAALQLAAFWYEAQPAPAARGVAWRPGLFVEAYLKAADAGRRDAVSIPASALLYHQGRVLVYVRLDPGKYARREVVVLGREGDRCIVAARQGLAPSGVTPGEPVVHRQAQILLSEEFRIDVDND